MLSLADQLSVPQVFFNDNHIGGADDTLALLKQWEEEGKYQSSLERYQKEIESQPGPTDPRLALPTTPPVVEKPPPPRNEAEDSIELPDKVFVSVLDITRTLMEKLPCGDLSHYGKNYKKSFKGTEAVQFFKEYYGFSDLEAAVRFGVMLQERHIIHHVTKDHVFGDTNYFFRLQPYQNPRILNSFRVWTDRVDPDSMSLLARLNKLMGSILSNVTDSNGNIDYLSASKDPKYITFEENVCELQGVSMTLMDNKTKLAFGINLYNLMIKYAFVKLGIPGTNLQRYCFFDDVSFDIGGDILSFSDLENGVLRGNKKPPAHLNAPFSKKDPRRKLVLDEIDPRIHFGLNCGAKSCPPVKKFTVDAIEEELRIVALAFCEQDDSVHIDEDKFELHLSAILKWYRSDFVASEADLPKRVVEYLRGEKKEKLQKMIDTGNKDIKVKFITYDWSTNASKSKTFSSGSIKSSSYF